MSFTLIFIDRETENFVIFAETGFDYPRESVFILLT
jgi:hypothetical protein